MSGIIARVSFFNGERRENNKCTHILVLTLVRTVMISIIRTK